MDSDKLIERAREYYKATGQPVVYVVRGSVRPQVFKVDLTLNPPSVDPWKDPMLGKISKDDQR